MRLLNYEKVDITNATAITEKTYTSKKIMPLFETRRLIKRVIKRTQERRWFLERNVQSFIRSKGDNTTWGSPHDVTEITPMFGDEVYKYLDDSMRAFFVAVHESGHFLADNSEGRKPKYVSIVPKEISFSLEFQNPITREKNITKFEEISLGHIEPGRALGKSEIKNLSEKATQSRVFTLLAGPVAENVFSKIFRTHTEAISGTDAWEIDGFLRNLNQSRYDPGFKNVLYKTEHWVKNNLQNIELLAKKLIEYKKLTREQIQQFPELNL